MSIIEEVYDCGVMVLGDFNCNVVIMFYQEWILACEGHGLTFSDVKKLPASTYTHVNNFSLSKTWLDHCFCSQTVHIVIENFAVNYNFCGSDHIPIVVEIKIRAYFEDTADRDEGASIKWDFQNEMKAERFYTSLCANLNADYEEDLFCMNEFCCSIMHRRTMRQQ